MSEKLILFSSQPETYPATPLVPEALKENHERLLAIIQQLQSVSARPVVDKEYQQLEKITESLAGHKCMGVFHPNTPPAIRRAFRNAQNLLCQVAPVLGSTLAAFEPDKALQELLDMSNDNPFHLAGLECTKTRESLADAFDIASQYPRDQRAYLQMQTYLKIGKFNPIETIEFLEKAAALIITWLCKHPVSRTYIEQTEKEKSERNNLNLLQAATAANFKILGITGNVQIILRNSRSGQRRQASYRRSNNKHMLFINDIEKLSAEEIIAIAGHECIHAWQAHTQTVPNYKQPALPTHAVLHQEAKTRPPIKFVPVSRQKKQTAMQRIQIDGKIKKIPHSNLARAIMGFGKDGINFYKREAHERIAYGYQHSLLGEWHKRQNNQENAEKHLTAADQFFSDDRNQKIFASATARVTRLMNNLTFTLPLRNNPTAKPGSLALMQ
jgi:hypothetical protein